MKTHFFKPFTFLNLGLLLITLYSCHKDVQSNRTFDPNVSAATTINIKTSEIGGKSLKLVSSRDDDSPISDNSFFTVVSREGEQILLVTDENDEIRGLTLSTPTASSANVMEINTNSTAISLVFISPGISTIDSQEATSTINRIENLSSFKPFKTFLENNLNIRSLNSLVGTELYDSLLADCVEEYYLNFIINKKGPVKGSSGSINMVSYSHNSNDEILIKNYAFRFINVVERDVNSSRQEINTNNVLPQMKGSVPLSWGSLFTLSTLDPTTGTINYNPAVNSSISEFWICGPGFKPVTEIPPQSVKNIDQPWVETTVYYVIFPLIDLFSGAKSLLKMATPEFKVLMTQIKTGKQLYFLTTSETNIKSICRNVSNFAIAIVGAIALYSTGALATTVGSILAVSSVLFGGSNLVSFVFDMTKLQPYSKFEVVSEIGPPIIPMLSSPENNSSQITLPVTFFWNNSPNAKSYTLQISKFSDFSQLEYNQQGITTTGRQVTSLQNGIKYYWRVNASNDNGTSPWSNVWSFTTLGTSGLGDRVLYYAFNGNLNDGSGNNHNGTPQGTPVYSSGYSGRGQAASFNGAWRYIVNNSTPTGFSLTGDWTIAFSVFPRSNASWGNGFIQRFYRASCSSTSSTGYGIYIFDDGRAIHPQNGYMLNTNANNYVINNMNIDAWNRIIIVHRTNHTGDIYVNGVKTFSSVPLPVGENSTKQMSVGGNYQNEGCYGAAYANNVMIDDLVLLNFAASESQISNDSLGSPLGSN